MFTIGESRAISHVHDTEQQAQQVVGNARRRNFPPKLLWRTPTKINQLAEQRRQPRSVENIA